MFRKSHLLPIAPHLFDAQKQLTKADFKTFPWGTLIIIRWSKTIQFRERIVEIPLPLIPGSTLCPTSAIYNAFRFTAPISSRNFQAFNWVDTGNIIHTFTYSTPLYLNCCVIYPLWGSIHAICGSFFSQGGASFAYQSGVPIELIKALGDWRSDTLLIYLTMPLTVRLLSANMLCKSHPTAYFTPSLIRHTSPFSTPCTGFGPLVLINCIVI